MNRLKVFGSGLKVVWSEKPFKSWVVICAITLAVSILVGVEWVAFLLMLSLACIGLGMEAANTSVELLMDIVHPPYSKKVKLVKDSFAVMPILAFTSYVVSWLTLVAPSVCMKVVE